MLPIVKRQHDDARSQTCANALFRNQSAPLQALRIFTDRVQLIELNHLAPVALADNAVR